MDDAVMPCEGNPRLAGITCTRSRYHIPIVISHRTRNGRTAPVGGDHENRVDDPTRPAWRSLTCKARCNPCSGILNWGILPRTSFSKLERVSLYTTTTLVCVHAEAIVSETEACPNATI
ncbi:hypothetical protein VTK73DRAFT_7385 [Phialemonium thermophilum]|uniref:Uncharacterized protein n=1 Tax=Phialemonium thermophilum TaxID=223376 RepID=A0ABR3WEN4_9PEZI